MNPWTIIGWAIIIAPTFFIFLMLIASLIKLARDRVYYYKTRSVTPMKGQIWIQDNEKLYIQNVYENGNISIMTVNPLYKHTSSCASWSDTQEKWKERVKNRKLYLSGHWE